MFAVVLRENNKVIGSVGVLPSLANDHPMYGALRQKRIGYVLSKAYWGKGIMTEAVRAVLAFCFDTLDLEAVTVEHYLENVRSRRVVEKCEFMFLQSSERFFKRLGKTFDALEYILLRDHSKM